jgi:predicted Zn-dependent peptidase
VFNKTVLANGLRVVSREMPGTRSVSLGIWVENGSRHETRRQNGISHFIEHLFFKGTEQRSAARIAEEMDSVGGVLNAFTAKEYTCYYAKVLDENLPLAIDLLSDIFLNSVFDSEEIERERQVILQEISQSEDTPDDYVHDLFSLDFFADHPLGRPICGDAETVKALGRDDFLAFVRERYLPGRVIVSAAGNLKHEYLAEEIGRRLGSIQRAHSRDGEAGVPQLRKGVFQHAKKLEQAHLCFGVAAVHQSDPRRYVAYVLNTLLGGGMSSRLFQEIREKRGRVYSVYSFLASYRDVGYLGVYAGTSVEWGEEVVELVIDEIKKLAAGEVRAEEIERTRNQLVGNMILGLESSDSWMRDIAKDEIYYGRAIPLDDVIRDVRAVTRDQVIELAATILRPEAMALTLLADIGKKKLDFGRSFGV